MFTAIGQTAPHLDGDNTWEPIAGANWQTTVSDWSAVKFVKFTYTNNNGVVANEAQDTFNFPMMVNLDSADKEEVLPGEEVHYTIDATNSGNTASDSGKVTFPIPDGMEVVDLAGGTLSPDGKSIVYDFDPITWDESAQFYPVLKVPADAKTGTTIQAQSYISELGGVELDPTDRIMSNTVDVKVVAKEAPSKTPSKTVGTTSTLAKTGDATPFAGIALIALATAGALAATSALAYSRRRKAVE